MSTSPDCAETKFELDTRTEWVGAHEFGAHLRHLTCSTGVPWRALAMLAGVSSRTVGRLMGRGRPLRRIRAVDAERILLLCETTIETAQRQLVDPTSTLKRVHALLQAGHSLPDIAGYLSLSPPQLGQLITGPRRHCTMMTRMRAQAACEAHGLLWADSLSDENGAGAQRAA